MESSELSLYTLLLTYFITLMIIYVKHGRTLTNHDLLPVNLYIKFFVKIYCLVLIISSDEIKIILVHESIFVHNMHLINQRLLTT